MNIPAELKCKNCKHYEESQNYSNFGYCKQLRILQSITVNTYPGVDSGVNSIEVPADFFCGEFELKQDH